MKHEHQVLYYYETSICVCLVSSSTLPQPGLRKVLKEFKIYEIWKNNSLKNILRWLTNYQETGYQFCDVTPSTTDEQIRNHERKIRADNFIDPDDVDILINELENIIIEYQTGMDLEQIQLEWNILRPKLTSIFHEKRVLPEFLVKKIPSNE